MLRSLSAVVFLFACAVHLDAQSASPAKPTGKSAPPPPAAKAAAPPKTHPKTGGESDCTSCHRATHSGLVADYEASPHGRGLVGCIACHNSTGADFLAKPTSDRCMPCHAAKVDSLKSPVMKGKNCWTCHVAHRLNPHAALWKN